MYKIKVLSCDCGRLWEEFVFDTKQELIEAIKTNRYNTFSLFMYLDATKRYVELTIDMFLIMFSGYIDLK